MDVKWGSVDLGGAGRGVSMIKNWCMKFSKINKYRFWNLKKIREKRNTGGA